MFEQVNKAYEFLCSKSKVKDGPDPQNIVLILRAQSILFSRYKSGGLKSALGFRPDMTFAVDWVLKNNYLSIQRSWVATHVCVVHANLHRVES